MIPRSFTQSLARSLIPHLIQTQQHYTESPLGNGVIKYRQTEAPIRQVTVWEPALSQG